MFLTNFDEFQFCLVPQNPYFWQPTLSIEMAKSNRDVAKPFSEQKTTLESLITADYSYKPSLFSRLFLFSCHPRVQ